MKNFEEINRALGAKKKLMIIASCALLLFAAGCKDNNVPESFKGNEASPAWTAPEVSDMTSSMTAVVKVDLKAQYPDQAADFVLKDEDRLAAFIGNDCVGIAAPKEGLFFLYIAGKEATVTLRYFSAHYKNLFEAKEAFAFHNDDRLGTVAEPLAPKFIVAK